MPINIPRPLILQIVFINILQPLGLRPLILSLSWKKFGRLRAWIEHAAAELNESSVRWEPEPQDPRRLCRKLFHCIRLAHEDEKNNLRPSELSIGQAFTYYDFYSLFEHSHFKDEEDSPDFVCLAEGKNQL